jgi:hypothetical protein
MVEDVARFVFRAILFFVTGAEKLDAAEDVFEKSTRCLGVARGQREVIAARQGKFVRLRRWRASSPYLGDFSRMFIWALLLWIRSGSFRCGNRGSVLEARTTLR